MGSEGSVPVPGWTSARLEIVPMRRDHLDQLVAYRRQPDVARWQSWDTDYSLTDADGLVVEDGAPAVLHPGEWMQLAICRARPSSSTLDLVGDIGLHLLADQPDSYELGVTIDPRHQGNGFAREALSTLIDRLMDGAAAHRIFLQTDARNAPMIALALALGLRHEGADVEADWFKGEWTTLERFALLRREWQARQARDGG